MYKRYISWENGMEIFTYLDLVSTYEKDIDKLEYPTFLDWLADMLKMGILIEEK